MILSNIRIKLKAYSMETSEVKDEVNATPRRRATYCILLYFFTLNQ